MRIKTYTAPDLATALAEARREMGPDALVLATNEIRGRLGLTQAEITVGFEPPARPEGHERLRRLAREVEQLRNRVEPHAPRERPANGSTADRGAATPRLVPAVESAVEALVRSGLARDLALRFARCASSHLRSEDDAGELTRAAERAMQQLVAFAEPPTRSSVLFVVGPPGAGKTTTAAKLAARTSRRSRRPVLWAQADGDRPGAGAQAQVLADRLGIPLHPACEPSELGAVIESAPSGSTVIVDTSGVGARDGTRLDRLATLRETAPRAQVALLVPAGLHADEARRVIDRFDPVRPTCVALSKVDDGGRLGELVTAVAPTRLPFAFMTNGHRLPDLQEISPRSLTALLLRAGFASSTTEEKHG